MNSSKITIIVVNYQCADLTATSINSLFNNSSLNPQIIVVDNSPISEVATLTNLLPNAVIIRQNENLGYASGVNYALQNVDLSLSEYILLLNPDTYCTSDFLAIMKNFLEENTQVVAVSPKILKADESVWYAGGTISILKGGPKHYYSTQNLREKYVEFLTACCMLIRKDLFIKIGGLPEKYFLYFEDAELSVKLRKAGYLLAYLPEAILYHHVSATTQYASNNYVRLFARNRIIFMRDNFTNFQYYLFLALHLIVRTPIALFFFLLRGELSNIHAYLKGLMQGLSYKSKLL
jgi:GT2 family glycosyltransferase